MAKTGVRLQVYLKIAVRNEIEAERERVNEAALARGDMYQYTASSWMLCLAMESMKVRTEPKSYDLDAVKVALPDGTVCEEWDGRTEEDIEAEWREASVPKGMRYVAHLDDRPERVGFGGTRHEAVRMCLEKNRLGDGEHCRKICLHMTHPVVASDHVSFDATDISERVDLEMWSGFEDYQGDDRGLGLSDEQDKEVEALLTATLKGYLRERNLDRQDYFAPGRLIRSQQAQFEIVDGELSRFMFVTPRCPAFSAERPATDTAEYAAYCELLEGAGYTVIGHTWLALHQIYVARGDSMWMGVVLVSLGKGCELPEVPTFF